MNEIISQHENQFLEVIEYTKKELATLRTGRANPVIVENVQVESYGVMTPLKQLASISVPEARTLVITPWDHNVIKDIEKAIVEANIGISPVNEGKLIRLTIPQLTAESRKELVKNVQQRLENGRIKIRGIRDKIRDEIIKSEKSKSITEDDKFTALKELDTATKKYNDNIKEIGDKKEEEIMTI
jgi:ribosome recycling factor